MIFQTWKIVRLNQQKKHSHHADMRIIMGLNDGFKVNYGKLGDLLDSLKLVTGGSGDD